MGRMISPQRRIVELKNRPDQQNPGPWRSGFTLESKLACEGPKALGVTSAEVMSSRHVVPRRNQGRDSTPWLLWR
jgi:hypothetical protein